MAIANKTEWVSQDTKNLAKALDAIGFETDAESFMDDYVELLAPSAMVERLAEMIEETVEGMNDELYSRMDAMESEFYTCVEDYDFDYEQIATAYVKEYVQKGYGGYAAVEAHPTPGGVTIRQWNKKSGQTSRNSKTSLKQNGKKRTGRAKNGYRFLRIYQQVHARTVATAGRLSLGIWRLDWERVGLLLRGGVQQETGQGVPGRRDRGLHETIPGQPQGARRPSGETVHHRAG